MPRELTISVGQYSDKGRKDTNQDFHGTLIPTEPLLSLKGIAVVIADGISSSAVSGEASESAVKSFLTDADPKKREKLIDKLLADARFAAHQADVWDLMLFGRNPPGGDAVRNRDGFSFGQFVRQFPHLKGKITDLLIGDLFDDRVDEVWGPLESLYPPDKQSIPSWTDEAPPEVVSNKVNELFLPDGPVR